MMIIEVAKEDKTHKTYALILDSKYGLMLESECGEAMGISEQELFEIFDKYFKEKY